MSVPSVSLYSALYRLRGFGWGGRLDSWVRDMWSILDLDFSDGGKTVAIRTLDKRGIVTVHTIRRTDDSYVWTSVIDLPSLLATVKRLGWDLDKTIYWYDYQDDKPELWKPSDSLSKCLGSFPDFREVAVDKEIIVLYPSDPWIRSVIVKIGDKTIIGYW